MKLQSIIKGLVISDRRGRFEDDITGITSDSRAVQPGDLFVAVQGLRSDGHDFIGEAVERGARAVIAERWDASFEPGEKKVDVVLVPSSRRALGLAAANFYGQPSRGLHVAGVTGTNGKTTVTYLLESIIRAASKKVGVIGSVDARFDGEQKALEHTTPGPVELQRLLAAMVEAEVTHVVMEVSSHALAQERVAGVHFKVGGFTQLGRDHLDYHETMDAYFEAKARLFSEGLGKSRARGRMAVINVDDPRGRELLERCQGWGVKVLGVSSGEDPEAEVTVLEADYGLDGTRARIRTSKGEWDIRTRLVGPHNLANVCVAVGMALAMGFAKARIAPGLEALERVPGRLERIPDENGRVVFVDYAHTPDALAQTLDALRPHVEGRLWIVFGAGGDRDADKRGPMGEAAGRRVDGAIVTSDNPRGEAPDAIAAQLAAGLEQAGLQRGEDGVPGPGTFVLELDRQAAIHAAVGALEPQDVLLIAGKGSETVQVLEDRRYLFDDREVARRALEGAAPLELELAPAPEPAFTAPRAVTEQVDVEDVLDETLEVEEGSIEATEADEKGSEET